MLVKACPSMAPSYIYMLSGCLFGNYFFRSSGVLLFKSRRTFCFPFLQTSAICIFLPCLLVTCMFFWSKQVFQMLCYFLYHLIIMLSSKERVQWALYLFPFQHTLAHVLIHQRKIDKDLQNQIITKAAILYPTVHFVSWVEPRLLFSIFVCSFFKTFVFLWQFYVCFKALLALFGMIQKKLHVFLREW